MSSARTQLRGWAAVLGLLWPLSHTAVGAAGGALRTCAGDLPAALAILATPSSCTKTQVQPSDGTVSCAVMAIPWLTAAVAAPSTRRAGQGSQGSQVCVIARS